MEDVIFDEDGEGEDGEGEDGEVWQVSTEDGAQGVVVLLHTV